MQSTTSVYFQQIAGKINQIELANFVQLFQLAISGATTESQKTVFQMLKQVESRPQSYLYFLYIFLNPQYDENLRIMTGTTMKSALERNSKDLHFDQGLKTVMKAALLSENNIQSQKLRSIQNILISQLAICFEEVDWQLVYFLIQKTHENPEILSLLCTIFEDLKHNKENCTYFQGAVQTQVIESLFKTIHQLVLSNLSKINFMESHSFLSEIKILTQSFKLVRIITFHLPLKLSEYLHTFINQIVIHLLNTLSTLFSKDQIPLFLSKCNLAAFKSLVIEFFESINEISQTKCQYLLQNKSFLDHFVLYFPLNCEEFRRHFQEVCKIWTNTILELLINDQPEQAQHEEENVINYEKFKMFGYVDVIISRVIVGFKFTKEDEAQIIHEMQLEHNPYNMERPLNEEGQGSDDQGNFQTKHGKAYGSTLRKVSITCIEKLCQQYQQSFWENNKTIVYEMLQNQTDYKIQQSAIVFIGIMAENCPEALRDDAIQILQFLSLIPNKLCNQFVIASTLWAFEKLLSFYISETETKKFVYQLIYKVLGNKEEYQILKSSKNMMVKEAAVSLLDQLLSQQTDIDLQIIRTMVECLIYALETFTGRALFNVFKAISSIFEQSQRQNIEHLLVGEVVKHLCLKWSVSVEKDSIMCPLIECLSNICENRKKYFIEFACEILQQICPLFKETERKSLVLRVIDLATSIIIAAKDFPQSSGYQKIKGMVSCDDFLTMMNSLILSEEKEIRHFAYGLLSDITKLNGISDDKAYYFIQTIAQSMDRSNPTSINNALMCLTDVIDYHREVGAKHTKQIMEVIVDFIVKFTSSNLPKIYLLNFSRMFGRLAQIDTNSAREFCLTRRGLLKIFSQGLRSQEKSQLTLSAYHGLTLIINSLTAEQLITFMESKEIESFIDSFMAYKYNSQSVQNMNQITQLFNQMKSLLSGRNIFWTAYLNSTLLYPATIQKILHIVS